MNPNEKLKSLGIVNDKMKIFLDTLISKDKIINEFKHRNNILKNFPPITKDDILDISIEANTNPFFTGKSKTLVFAGEEI